MVSKFRMVISLHKKFHESELVAYDIIVYDTSITVKANRSLLYHKKLCHFNNDKINLLPFKGAFCTHITLGFHLFRDNQLA